MPPTQRKDDHALIATALDHTWRWFEFWQGQSIQGASFYMLSVAVLSAGYVSVLNAKLYVAAAAISVVGMLDSIGAYLITRRLRQISRWADEPMIALQDRLASALNIDSLRMMESHRFSRPGPWLRSTRLLIIGIWAAVLLSLAATSYALFGH